MLDAGESEDGHLPVAGFARRRGLVWLTVWLLTLSLALGGVSAAPQTEAPQASFEYAPSTPSPDETVTFDASASSDPDGEITEYRWYVDGRRQYNDSPTLEYAFEVGGSYEVELIVTDNDGTEASVSKTVTVDNAPPDPSYSYSPSAPSPDESVTFDASASSDPDGEIVEYRWYVDGRRQYNDSPTLEYAFDVGGTYEVTLTVEDNGNTERSVTNRITVDNTPPRPRFTYAPTPPSPDETVTFDAGDSTDPDGEITEYRWYVDGQRQYNDSPTLEYAFDTGGKYEIRLTVIDNGEVEASETQQVTVDNTAPQPEFSFSPTGPAPEKPVRFDASASSDPDGEITEYRWYVDGRRQYNDSPTFEYAFDREGTYEIKLVVVDNGEVSRSTTRSVEVVNIAPTAKFETGADPIVTDRSVTFDGTASTDPDGSVEAYRWELDGRLVSRSGQFEETFTQPGTYEIELRVEDNAGKSDTVTRDVQVTVAPTADVDVAAGPHAVGRPVRFDASGSRDEDGRITAYRWSVDGAWIGDRATLERRFAESGVYNVTLRLTDDAGAQTTTTRSVTVHPVPDAALDVNRSTALRGEVVSVRATAALDNVSYEWRVTGGELDVNRSAGTVRFDDVGTQTLRLTVTSQAGITERLERTVTVDPALSVRTDAAANTVVLGNRTNVTYVLANHRTRPAEIDLSLALSESVTVWQVDGARLASETALETITVPANGEREITIEYNPAAAGEYELGGQLSYRYPDGTAFERALESVTVTVQGDETATPAATGATGAADERPSGSMPGFGMLPGLVAVVCCAGLLGLHRRHA